MLLHAPMLPLQLFTLAFSPSVPSGSLLSFSTLSGSAHLHPTPLHSAPFPRTHSSQHAQSKTNPSTCGHVFLTFRISEHLPPSDPPCTNVSCSLSLKHVPPSQIPPRIWRSFSAVPRKGKMQIYVWVRRFWLHLPGDAQLTELFISGQRVDFPAAHLDTAQTSWERTRDDSWCLRGQVFPTRKGGGLAKGNRLLFPSSELGGALSWICTYSEGQRAKNN